jgi:leucyl aminopeptidase
MFRRFRGNFMDIAFIDAKAPDRLAKDTGNLAVVCFDGRALGAGAKALDAAAHGAIARGLNAQSLSGSPSEELSLLAPHGLAAKRALVFGLGKPGELSAKSFEELGGRIVRAMKAQKLDALTLLLDSGDGQSEAAASAAARVAYGAALASYRFTRHLVKKAEEAKKAPQKLTIATASAAAARKAFAPLAGVAEAIAFTRDLVSEPANVLYPVEFAKRAADTLTPLGLKVEILGEKEMKKLGFGALLAVGQGSERESQLVVMHYNGAGKGKNAAPLAFVGKGVTFDTGGISIKPAAGMEDMKWDMAGAGVVTGLMMALAKRKAKVNAVGVIGLVENMPSGSATRPGDIVKSLSGQTVEILNTDAEGRLVLADALWYVQTRHKPKLIVDLATLTGAIMISLGQEYAGLFSNNDELAQKLTEAGEKVGEKLWRMPMGEAYDKMLDTEAADMKNIGGKFGGSITAAQFLKRFIQDVPWAHLDIAGMAWSSSGGLLNPKGATGYGVRLLDRFVADHYEG